MKPEIENKADVVIVGAGAAGLFAALTLAPRRVIVLSEKPLGGICASAWAQGGIAAAVDKDDTAQSHAADTMKAAAGTAAMADAAQGLPIPPRSAATSTMQQRHQFFLAAAVAPSARWASSASWMTASTPAAAPVCAA